MKALLLSWFQAYFTSWWRPLAHYAVVLALLVALMVSGWHLAYGAMLGLFSVLVTCLAVFGFGMLAAACTNFYKKRKLEGLANLIFFLCTFLLPAGLYYFIIAMMTEG